MTRKLSNPNIDTRMKNNRNKNREFENACREVGLSAEQKQKFSKSLHQDKEFQTGDYEYTDLVEAAKEFK